MRRGFILLATITLLTSCRWEKDYRPASHLSVQQQEDLMQEIIRYVARSPEGIRPEQRLETRFDEHYQEQRRMHRLDACYRDGDVVFFLVSRPAPSLTEKRVAIGGLVERDQAGAMIYYEEIFRTWKMEPDTLERRALFLFDRMVRDEDLKGYYSSKTGNTDYIE
ncbi:MAG: hypothetical protein JNN04_09770, partial [Cyclobacteriaceae bacterium]|nr:hypothetical protein [Cyclobacteriaceae bacterium]